MVPSVLDLDEDQIIFYDELMQKKNQTKKNNEIPKGKHTFFITDGSTDQDKPVCYYTVPTH